MRGLWVSLLLLVACGESRPLTAITVSMGDYTYTYWTDTVLSRTDHCLTFIYLSGSKKTVCSDRLIIIEENQ